MKMTKKFLAVLLAMTMVMSMAACGGSKPAASAAPAAPATPAAPTASAEPAAPAAPAEKKVKETLTVTLSGEPTSLNPHFVGQLNAYIVDMLIYDTLLLKAPDGSFLPNIATEWKEIDDTHIQFKLRDDVSFSNGKKMTAEDVLFTIKCLTESATTKSTYQYFDAANSKAVDEYTIELALKQPFAAVYNFLTHPYSSIVCKSHYEEVGSDEYGINPVGTGAYTLEKWTSGSSILLKRKDNYWGEKGASPYVNVKFIAEAANRTIELETGGTDIALDISTTDAPRVESSDKMNLVTIPSYRASFIAMNQSKPEFADKRIGQALSLATDTKTLAEVAYAPYGTVADSVVSAAIAEHRSTGEHEYNPEKAKQLLAEAGYPNGITLSGRCQTIADFKVIAEIAQNMWKQAGINLEVQVLDKASYSELGKTNGGTHITITSQTATTGDVYQALGSMYSTTSTTGIFNSSDTHLESLIQEAAGTYDDAKRAERYGEIQEYIVGNYFAIPVGYNQILYGVSNQVQDFVASPANTPNLKYTFAYEG